MYKSPSGSYYTPLLASANHYSNDDIPEVIYYGGASNARAANVGGLGSLASTSTSTNTSSSGCGVPPRWGSEMVAIVERQRVTFKVHSLNYERSSSPSA